MSVAVSISRLPQNFEFTTPALLAWNQVNLTFEPKKQSRTEKTADANGHDVSKSQLAKQEFNKKLKPMLGGLENSLENPSKLGHRIHTLGM